MKGMNSGFAWNPKTKAACFDVSVTDATGHRHRHRTTETCHASRADALKAWSAFRDRVRAGQGERKAWTLRAYWTVHRERFANVASVVETRLLPVLGDRLLEKINGAVVKDLVAQMTKAGYVKHGEPRHYSPSTLRSTVAVLKMIVGDAADREDIEGSQLRGRLRLLIPREVPLRQELSDDEHKRFVAAFDDEEGFRRLIEQTPGPVRVSDRFGGKPRVFGSGRRPDSEAAGIFFERFRASRPLFVVALETGLRRGDLLALSWKSVDLVNGWIRVTMQKTKLEAAVPISKVCKAALAEARARAPFSPLVFVADDEKSPFPIATLVRYFATAKKLAGITRRFRFHDCRHTFASKLASKGVSLQIIAKALGHSSTRMSERYARPDEHALAAVRKALDSSETDTSTDTQEKFGAAGSGVSADNSLAPKGFYMERDTRVELATSTLAR
jgi:integrase